MALRSRRLTTMVAMCALAIADLALTTRGTAGLRALVSRCPVRKRAYDTRGVDEVAAEICRAVDVARIHHARYVRCLPRSAAITCLLRWYAGIDAQCVIGVRRIPFSAHAWVEVDGAVVSDLPNVTSRYQAIARF
jgi:hypothetical protein